MRISFIDTVIAANPIRLRTFDFNAFLPGTEMMSPSLRNAIGTSLSLMYGVSICLCSLFAYYIREWRWFLRSLSGASFVLLIPGFWFVSHVLLDRRLLELFKLVISSVTLIQMVVFLSYSTSYMSSSVLIKPSVLYFLSTYFWHVFEKAWWSENLWRYLYLRLLVWPPLYWRNIDNHDTITCSP